MAAAGGVWKGGNFVQGGNVQRVVVHLASGSVDVNTEGIKTKEQARMRIGRLNQKRTNIKTSDDARMLAFTEVDLLRRQFDIPASTASGFRQAQDTYYRDRK